MFKLPLKCPQKPIITQYYGNTSNNAWYIQNGVNIPWHNGCDLIMGDNRQTYGTALVCPFPSAKVTQLIFDNPMSTKGNGIYLESDLIDGAKYRIVLWHVGEIKVMYNDIVKEGDILGYVGNSGLCKPSPTVDLPYNGSHLHFGLYKLVNGQYVYEGKTVLGESDPLKFFDPNQWYVGEDSGPQHDMAPLMWRWNLKGIKDWWMKMIDAFIYWK